MASVRLSVSAHPASGIGDVFESGERPGLCIDLQLDLSTREVGDRPAVALANLDIFVADTQTLFTMKCAAARTEEDAADIRVLAHELAITTPGEAFAIVEQYYASDRLPVRTRLLLEEIFDDGS